jgi:glycosidase
VDTGLYTPFDYPMYYATQDTFAKGQPMTWLAHVLSQDSLYPHPERLVPFLDNHDQPRIASRISDLAERRLAFAFLLTTRGMPQLYAGDEIGMTGGDDPDNQHDFPGGFPGDAHDAFTEAGRSAAQQTEFSWISELTTLRRKQPALACGGEQVLAANQDWLVTLRDLKHQAAPECMAHISETGVGSRVLVALHRGTAAATFDLPINKTWMEGCSLKMPMLGSEQDDAKIENGTMHLQLGGNDVLIAACE